MNSEFGCSSLMTLFNTIINVSYDSCCVIPYLSWVTSFWVFDLDVGVKLAINNNLWVIITITTFIILFGRCYECIPMLFSSNNNHELL